MAKNSQVEVKQTEPEIPVEILASSIVEIATGMKKLRSSRLQDQVIEHLISWRAGVSIVDVRKVLFCLEHLEGLMLKKKI